MANAEQRQQLAGTLLARTREILNEGPLTRDRLGQIETKVSELAAHADLRGEEDFNAPPAGEKQNRFLIAQENPTGLTLYLNVVRPGKKIPPHDHTTWACVGAVAGSEINTVYRRLDDGSRPGEAMLEAERVVDLSPGNALSLMPDDIHSVEIRGTDIIRHLHFYGQPLETLSDRTMYNLEEGTCKKMDIGVKTQGAARA
ncbi:MAG: cysteine dioxygenase family protein [Pseudomonadota bacterium]